ncbi:hypothetical protein N431DRAFT_432313 [Stipitochalara longipes BDJ]|nr:hypothetical protein N431DRAFT_432313 [Stipitochalara longipes BDJ]
MAAVVGVFVVVFLLGAALVMDLSTQEIFIYIVAYVSQVRPPSSSLTFCRYSAILVTLLSNFLQVNPPGGGPQ